MRVIAKRALQQFCNREPRAQDSILAWYAEALAAQWETPADVKAKYGNASILKEGRGVFNICGNDFRLVVWINYEFFTIYVRFIGTHAEYDEIDAQTI